MLPIASSKSLFGASEYPEIINIAKEMIPNGQGDELIQMPDWYWITTPRSIDDLATNLPHLIEEPSRIKCPVLFILRDQEPEDLHLAEAFKKACKSTVDVVIIKSSNHFYVSAETTVKKNYLQLAK